MESYGFILTRHVNSETTNKYWNNAIRCIRRFYPHRKIIVIDDNSDPSFLNAEYEYRNVEYIQSEFRGRGELLPYYYYLHNKWFANAVILHDSVFFHRRINFESIVGRYKAIPIWHFPPDDENKLNMLRIANGMQNKYLVSSRLNSWRNTNIIQGSDWYGCFGVQSFINHDFLVHLNNKYRFTNLVMHVFTRMDRCALERIFGVMFYTELPGLRISKSLLGNILTYCRWGYTYDEYKKGVRTKQLKNSVVKVWTGR